VHNSGDNVEKLPPLHKDGGVLQEMLEADVTLISIKTPGTKTTSRWVTNTNISKLAADTGGEVLDAKSLDLLSYALNAAVQRLKKSYVIGFYPSDERAQGSYHNLKIILDRNKCSACKIWTRKGYYAGGHAVAASKTRKSTPLQSKKYGIPIFGLLITSLSSSPHTLLYNEALKIKFGEKVHTQGTSDAAGGQAVPLTGIYAGNSLLGNKADVAFQSELLRLIEVIDSAPVTSNYISQRYLTGLKMLWTNANKAAVSLLFSYLFEKYLNPQFNDVRKRLKFQIVANGSSETENKQVIKIDLKCDASQLFFFFSDERYKTWLVLAPNYGEKGKSDSFIKLFEPSYSEEEFAQILQSGIPVSFTMEIPKAEQKFKLIVFNPIMSIYDIKEVDVQR
jgi:hypothetical protein